MECPNCGGKGSKSTSRGATYSCKACAGSGRLECSPQCSSCNGTGEITEEFQKETREKYTPKFANYSPDSAVVWPLLALNVLVYVLVTYFPREQVYFLYLSIDSLERGQYWAFLTSSFIHWTFLHLFLNMGFLVSYGPPLEGLLGKGRFAACYLFAALTAGLASFLGNVWLAGSYFAGAGASGPLFGMVGAYIALQYRWRMVTTINLNSLVRWTGGLLVLGFCLEAGGIIFLDNWGHLGGLLGGLLFNLVLPRPRGR